MTASALRTIVLRPRPRVYGVLMTEPPLRWPVAQPDDNLDYSLDVTALQSDAGEAIIAVSISVSPYGPGELVAVAASVSGPLITVWLSGGVAGRKYIVKVQAQTLTRNFEWLVGLLVNPQLAPSPLPTPPFLGFSASVTAGAAMPLALNLALPLSAGLAATLF